MRDGFGTTAVDGLNVAPGPHLIGDSQLRESFGGWTDEDGVWRPAPSPKREWTGYDGITAFAAGRMGGSVHQVWLDGGDLYDNGTLVGTITAGTEMDILALDDAFLIFGAAKNYIWDGTHLREQGTWQPDYVYSVNSTGTGSTAGASPITAIALSSPCVITINSNTFTVGDRVYITGITGTTQLNGRYFTVTASTRGASGTITISEDATGHTAWSSGGTVNGQTDLAGTYKFYYTQTIELSDGTILESRPRGMFVSDNALQSVTDFLLDPAGTWESSELTLSAGKYVIAGVGHGFPEYYGRYYFVYSGTTLYDCTGTYKRGVRIYRTKANGYDFYVEREYNEDDAEVSLFSSGGSSGLELLRMSLGIPDRDLGSVYTPGQYDHMSAPASTMGDVSAQICLVNSQADPDRVYWSSYDGIEYFNTMTGWDKRPDAVTGIIAYRTGFVVFSCDRMWFMRFTDGLPEWEEIPTSVGTVWPKAMWIHGGEVVWLRDDGLWSWGGAGEPTKVSRAAFDSITDPQSVTGSGDLLYVSGSEKAYVGIRRDNGVVWHECDKALPFASGTGGAIYAADQFGVCELFAGTRRGGRLRSKHFGNSLLSKAVRLVLDIEGETVPRVWINGNVQSDVIGHDEETRHTQTGLRKVCRVSVPRLNNQYVEVMLEVTGDVKVYGYTFEAAR